MKTISRDNATGNKPCLSAHEMATLLLLLHAPIDALTATPDATALQNAGLARLVDSDQGNARFAITDEGNAMLRALGAA